MKCSGLVVICVAARVLAVAAAEPVGLDAEEALAIGRKIWRNECGGTVAGLTSWNKGEDFASLGIGHFIWYPHGRRGPFEESFPKLVAFALRERANVPRWLRDARACPWPTREAFRADLDSDRMKSLRAFLSGTVALQARFCALRLEAALPEMLGAAPPGQRERIKANFRRVAAAPLGLYALIDYVNFKGEGTSPTERYSGEGWGLLQVLESMRSNGPPLDAFAAAADAVLERRVANSPPARNEARWLPGWRSRIRTYSREPLGRPGS